MSMEFYHAVREFHTYFELIIGILGVILNLLVCYMCVTTKNKTLKQFSIVILINVFGDLFYTILTMLVMPVSTITTLP